MELKVSKETALFVEALKEANVLYDKVMSAAEAYSGNKELNNHFCKDFNVAFNQMTDEIYKMMKASIWENVNTVGSDTI